MRELLKQSQNVLRERISYYYERGVPHQRDIPHCMCRKCIDDRIALVHTAIDAELAKPEKNTEQEGIFELEAQERSYSFPCSICKKVTQPPSICKKDCAHIYGATSMEIDDLKYEVQKLINNFKRADHD